VKLLVLAHRLELGGTQINAIELAAELRDAQGFDVVVHATPGPALPYLRSKGLPFRPAPDARFHPSPARMRALRDLARQERPDLVHAWDWWQGLEAYVGLHLTKGQPLVISDMMMQLTRAMPRGVPTTFGFAGLRQQAERAGWRRTHLLLPPVDTDANVPNPALGRLFRQRHGLGADDILLVSVSRLAEFMKSESLVRSIRLIRAIGGELPLRLVIVGDGEARPRLQLLADDANRHLGRRAVDLVGAMEDPRPAYAAADIVLGMGGSALRGLAHAAPVIVLGENGFARPFAPETEASFLQTGMFGRGDGSDAALEAALRELAGQPSRRDALGHYGRGFVLRHHGLAGVAEGFARFCRAAVAAGSAPAARSIDCARVTYWYLRERRFRVASRDAVVAAPPDPALPDALQS
jgi:glycosyltransferase involved in cell wall biosynthesis